MSRHAPTFAGSVEQATRDNLAGPTPLMRSSEILGSGISSGLPSADSASSHRSVAVVGVDGTVSASAALSPYLLAPVEPAAVEVGLGQAPEVNSNGGRVAGDCSAISCGVNRITGGRQALSESNAGLETGVTAGRDRQLDFESEVSALESEWARDLMREFFARKNSSTFRTVADSSIDVSSLSVTGSF